VLAYGTGTLPMPRNFLLPAFLTATAISVFMTPFARHLPDLWSAIIPCDRLEAPELIRRAR